MYHVIGDLVDMVHQGLGRLHITTHILTQMAGRRGRLSPASEHAQLVQYICASTVHERYKQQASHV